MSDNGGESAARPQRGPRLPRRRPRVLLPLVVALVLVIAIGSVVVELWTGQLWYDSVGHGGVYGKVLGTRVVLFVVFGLLLAAAGAGSVALAYRWRPVGASAGYRNPTVERYQDLVDPVRSWVIGVLAFVLFLFGGALGAAQWKTFMLWRNGVPFGQADTYFHRDVGFYVFSYPWYRFILTFGFTALVIGVVLAIVTHYVYGGIRLASKTDKMSTAAQVHLSVMLGLFMLVRAVSYWFDRYGATVEENRIFTGVSYTEAHAVIPGKTTLAIIALICAGLFFANAVRRGWLLPVLGFGLLVLSSIILGGIWPAIVQQFQADPSPDKEVPYVRANILATRQAYGLGNVDEVEYYNRSTDTPHDQAARAAEQPQPRVLDPRLAASAFQNFQQWRGFYTLPNVLDVDRYRFPGTSSVQDVVVGVREINPAGLESAQQSWANDHTVYTHGHGVVGAYAEQSGPGGTPDWFAQGLPTRGALGAFQQRVYFGEGDQPYAVVGAPKGAKPVEMDVPSASSDGKDQYSTYDGSGGVAIGSPLRRTLYALKFWDSSLLLSGRVNSESRLLYDREPREMVSKVAPWLTLDSDIYPAVVGGRLQWVVDGYTTSDDYPMANHLDVRRALSDSLSPERGQNDPQSDEINYMRNSVKATVDAYDGTVTLYAWDESDPMLRAWRSAFPGLVKPRGDISPELMEHLRYPQDLFKVQRSVFANYHVTNPMTLLNGSDRWSVATDPAPDRSAFSLPPYYQSVALPESASDRGAHYALNSVYTPEKGGGYLTAFMSVNADATSPRYGQLSVLRLSSNANADGPARAFTQIRNSKKVQRATLTMRGNGGVQWGSLLTLPLGDELMYVQSLYNMKSGRDGSYPVLQFVTVSVNGRVGIGREFTAALSDALQGAKAPPQGNDGDGGQDDGGQQGQADQTARDLLQKAQREFDAADEALRRNPPDFGAYQEHMQQAQKYVDQLGELVQSGQATLPGPTGSEPTTSVPSSSGPSPSGPSSSGPSATGPTTTGPTTNGPTGGTSETSPTTASPGD